jgi:5-methylcytosine-specific restriction endonuclease McrA
MTPEEADRARAQRRAAYWRNREKEIEAAKAYRAANPEVVKETWRKSNRARKEYLALYNQKNKDRIAARRKRWKEANRERISAVQAEYLQRNLDKHRVHQSNRRARKKENGGRLSVDIVQKLMKLQRGKCACCRLPLGNSYDLDHIVPLALGGANSDENMQLLRMSCNRQKGSKKPEVFMRSRGMLL